MTKKYTYYPGCSSHTSGKDFEESLQAVCKHLGVELIELPDWNCCGASATHIAEHEVGVQLSLRNLGMAEKMADRDVVTACAACYSHLKYAEYAAKKEGVKSKIGQYDGKISARNLIDIIHNEVGLDDITANVKNKLQGLKPVAYYGCLMLRPPEVMQLDNVENPKYMDDIVEALGGEPVHWSYKTECCGASLAIPRTDVVLKLVGKLLSKAEEAGANCIVTACPLCQLNVDSRQKQAGEELGKSFNLPVYYFTELMGIAFGINEYQTWLNRHIVDPKPLIDQALSAPADR